MRRLFPRHRRASCRGCVGASHLADDVKLVGARHIPPKACLVHGNAVLDTSDVVGLAHIPHRERREVLAVLVEDLVGPVL
jgi:hypothetical protein